MAYLGKPLFLEQEGGILFAPKKELSQAQIAAITSNFSSRYDLTLLETPKGLSTTAESLEHHFKHKLEDYKKTDLFFIAFDPLYYLSYLFMDAYLAIKPVERKRYISFKLPEQRNDQSNHFKTALSRPRLQMWCTEHDLMTYYNRELKREISLYEEDKEIEAFAHGCHIIVDELIIVDTPSGKLLQWSKSVARSWLESYRASLNEWKIEFTEEDISSDRVLLSFPTTEESPEDHKGIVAWALQDITPPVSTDLESPTIEKPKTSKKSVSFSIPE